MCVCVSNVPLGLSLGCLLQCVCVFVCTFLSLFCCQCACVGRNNYGQCGTGVKTGSSFFVAGSSPILTNVSTVVSGGQFACAITVVRALHCWVRAILLHCPSALIRSSQCGFVCLPARMSRPIASPPLSMFSIALFLFALVSAIRRALCSSVFSLIGFFRVQRRSFVMSVTKR